MKPSIRYYLAAYNLLAFVFWLLFLLLFISNSFILTEKGMLLLNIAQGMAVLEIVHALLKWVKSPLASTAAQVFSRIFVLILINLFRHHVPLLPITQTGIIIVSLAWSITEIVRYSFYLLLLFCPFRLSKIKPSNNHCIIGVNCMVIVDALFIFHCALSIRSYRWVADFRNSNYRKWPAV